MQRQVLSSSVAAIASTSIGLQCNCSYRRCGNTFCPAANVFAVIANIGMVSTAAFDDPISFDSFTACTLYFVLYFRWFRAVFSCFLSDWKPIKWTAFSDSSKMFAMYNCRLILVETVSGFAVGLALVQRLICGLKYIAVRLGPVGEGRTRA